MLLPTAPARRRLLLPLACVLLLAACGKDDKKPAADAAKAGPSKPALTVTVGSRAAWATPMRASRCAPTRT